MTEEESKNSVQTRPKKALTLPQQHDVLIGSKPVMNYVASCIALFNSGAKELTVKARGRSISRAVDTVEVLRRIFVKDLELKSVSLGTEEMTQKNGRKANVSKFELTIFKP